MIRGTILSGRGDLSACKAIRMKVFVEEQGFSEQEEMDDLDAVSLHGLVWYDEQPAATGRLYEQDGVFHAGRFAVLPAYRGRGLGDLVVRLMVNKAFELGADEVHLGAQDQAMKFYEKIGFRICGDAYRDGHVRHYPMVAGRDAFYSCEGHAAQEADTAKES